MEYTVPSTSSESGSLDWAASLGFDRSDLTKLNPCVPGEFTLPEAYYLNSATPNVVYRGTTEGTLPLVAGRWYLIPDSLAARYDRLIRDAVPVARAARLARL